MNNLLIRTINVLTYLTMLVIYFILGYVLGRLLGAMIALIGVVAIIPMICVYVFCLSFVLRRDTEITVLVYACWAWIFNAVMRLTPVKPA